MDDPEERLCSERGSVEPRIMVPNTFLTGQSFCAPAVGSSIMSGLRSLNAEISGIRDFRIGALAAVLLGKR